MVTIASLWLPILLSAVLVWIASAIIWTVMPHHKKEYQGLPDEEAVRNALKQGNPARGLYIVPHAADQKSYNTPEMKQKMQEGPVAYVALASPGPPNMGKSMALSFVFNLVISFFVAYLASRFLDTGSEYLTIFRLAGTVTWLAYAGATFWDSIWFAKPWKATWKHVGDSLVYALLTAGAFAGFWPG